MNDPGVFASRVEMRNFGEIPGYAPGSLFLNRAELSAARVHTPTQAGIAGSWDVGAESVVVSGGYEDDVDLGDVIIYTGHGGNDAVSGRQVGSQTLHRGNRALARSCQDGLPVRVIRGHRLKSPFSPEVGYEYAGLYRVDSFWRAQGISGYDVWQFRLEKLDEVPPVSPLQGKSAQDHFGIREDPPEYSAETAEQAARRLETVQRIVRNTRIAQMVKELHDFRCQICGVLLETAAGRYAESAHIRPLGTPHDGPDSLDNVLCLCPNHHVAFDLGGIYIRDDFTVVENLTGKPIGSLRMVPKHRIAHEYIRYHRGLFQDAEALSENG
jgi:putative restriction endonuclease